VKLYSIYDRAAQTYGAPFQAPNDALAVRLFEQTQLDVSHVFATHPGDFEINYLGEFDEVTAKWNLLDRPSPCFQVNAKELA